MAGPFQNYAKIQNQTVQSVFTKIISLSNEMNVGFLNQNRAMDSIKQEVIENSTRGIVYFIALLRKAENTKVIIQRHTIFFQIYVKIDLTKGNQFK